MAEWSAGKRGSDLRDSFGSTSAMEPIPFMAVGAENVHKLLLSFQGALFDHLLFERAVEEAVSPRDGSGRGSTADVIHFFSGDLQLMLDRSGMEILRDSLCYHRC